MWTVACDGPTLRFHRGGPAHCCSQGRSRPLLLLGCMRRVLNAQLREGTLEPIVYRKLDEDLKVCNGHM